MIYLASLGSSFNSSNSHNKSKAFTKFKKFSFDKFYFNFPIIRFIVGLSLKLIKECNS